MEITIPSSTSLAFAINVFPFQNPSSDCQVKFACQDTGSTFYKYISSTLSSLSCIFLNYLLSIALTVTPDSTSTVGGYSPLTISLSPSTVFPAGGIIQISPLILQNNPANCQANILQSAMIQSFTCSYSGNTVSITANNFTNGTQLTSLNTITLKIDQVQYNMKMSAESLTVYLNANSTCHIETSTNNNSWIPANPASFSILTMGIQSGNANSVCSSTNLLWTIQPKIQIGTSQWVYIELIGGVTAPSAPTVPTLSNSQSPGQIIQGTPNSIWTITDPNTVVAYPFLLPSTESPFYSRVTTYAGLVIADSEIVHRMVTAQISATRRK